MIHNIAIVPLLLVLISKYCLKNLCDFPPFKQSTAVCSQKLFCVPPGPTAAYKIIIQRLNINCNCLANGSSL